MDIKTVCPHCETQSFQNVEFDGWQTLKCHQCENDFDAFSGVTRAKRSRGHKASGSREYSIRAYRENGQEELLEFSSNVYDDVELRSKDPFIVTSVAGEIKYLQNLKIAKYWTINRPPDPVGCLGVATILVLAPALFALGAAVL